MTGKRIAYCVIPEAIGVFTFYQNLRRALQPYGWEVFALSVGPTAATRWDPAFADAGCVLIAPQERDPEQQARAFVGWVHNERIDIVLPMNDEIAASAVPHLGGNVRLVTRCANITRFACKTCVICLERLSRVIATTPRQLAGLRRFRRLPKERLSLIPHGVDISRFSYNAKSPTAERERRLRVAYLGQLVDQNKGILWLPAIAARLTCLGVEFELDIIGDGVDRAKLTCSLKRNGVEASCSFRGEMKSDDVARVLPTYDVFVMPSRFEGFPNVLVEAMAAGLVPVASRIRGVTDFIVEHGVSGVLCRIGDTKAFAEAIAGLAADRTRLATMSAAARRTVEERFSLERMGRDYDRVFREVLAEPLPSVAPRPWSQFRIDPAYKPGWSRWVPKGVKNTIRRYVG